MQRFPLLLAGFLLTALALEALSYRVGHRYSHDLADVVVPLKQEWIETGRAAAEIVFLGDSFVKSGIDPAAVESVAGRTTVNLGTNLFVTLIGQHFLVERLLSKHTPRILVLLVDLDGLRQDISTDEGSYYLAKEFLRLSEIRYLYRETGDESLLLSQLLNLVLPLPSLYYRNVVQGVLGNFLRGLPQARGMGFRKLGFSVDEAVRAFEDNDGLFPLENGRVGFDPSAEQPFRVNPMMGRELDRSLERCASSNVPVVFGINPMPESVRAVREARGYDAGLDDFVSNLRGRHPEVRFLDPLIRVYPDTDFYDRRHLLADAARRHSVWIAHQFAGLPTEAALP